MFQNPYVINEKQCLPAPLSLYTMPPILQQNPPSMIFQKFQPTLLSHYVWGGTKNFEESIINILKKTFKISQEEFENLKYLCSHIHQKTRLYILRPADIY